MSTCFTPDTRVALGPKAEPVEAKPKDGLTFIGVIQSPLRIGCLGKAATARQMLLEGATVATVVKQTGIHRAAVARMCSGLGRAGLRGPRVKAK